MLMLEKLRDNKKNEGKVRRLRNKTLGTIEGILGRNSRTCRELRRQVREACSNLRLRMKAKNHKKSTFLIKKYGMRDEEIGGGMLSSEEKLRYGGAKILRDEAHK